MKKIWPFILVIIVFILFTVILAFSNRDSKLYSRSVMGLAEDVVSHDMAKLPHQVANFYASVATTYFEVLKQTGNTKSAILSATEIIKINFPEKKDQIIIDRFLASLNYTSEYKFTDMEQQIITENLATSTIKVWNLKNDFVQSVAPPPKTNSPEMLSAIENSIELTNYRTLEQGALINFWSGMHMTPGIAGIWQDRLYSVTKNYYLKDEEYAFAQMILATSLSDTLNQVWQVKEKYKAPRPSKLSKQINLSMVDPTYPGYISEYSSTAYVAYNILKEFFPKGEKNWKVDLENASAMGVWAGCTFDFDEAAGRGMGERVFVEFKNSLNLSPISYGWFIPVEIFSTKVGVYKRSY